MSSIFIKMFSKLRINELLCIKFKDIEKRTKP